MKKLKIILSVLLPLLLPFAAAGLLTWLLPVKITLFVDSVLLLIILALLGAIVYNSKNRDGHE